MTETLDLVDEMMWEDSDKIVWITLEEAGLENQDFDTIPANQREWYYSLEN